MKLLPSLFSCVYSTVKFFVFAMNSRRRCSISVCFINGDRRKELKIRSYLCRLASAVSVMNNLSNVGINCMYPVADCKSLRHYHASTYTNCFDLSHSFWWIWTLWHRLKSIMCIHDNTTIQITKLNESSENKRESTALPVCIVTLQGLQTRLDCVNKIRKRKSRFSGPSMFSTYGKSYWLFRSKEVLERLLVSKCITDTSNWTSCCTIQRAAVLRLLEHGTAVCSSDFEIPHAITILPKFVLHSVQF